MIIAPDGKSLYVLNTDDTLTLYNRDIISGALIPLPVAKMPIPNGSFSVVISPDGGSVYVSAESITDGSTISVFNRSSSTGALTAQQKIATYVGGNLSISPDGGELFAITNKIVNFQYSGCLIETWGRNHDGSLVELNANARISTDSGACENLILSGDGKSVYASNFESGMTLMYRRD